MQESGRVPSARHSPEAASQPGDMTSAAAPSPEEPVPETAVPGNAHAVNGSTSGEGGGPAGSEEPGSSLPRRVRGASGRPRPPAHVAPPVLPESLLVSLRAAMEAPEEGEEQDTQGKRPDAKADTKSPDTKSPDTKTPDTSSPVPHRVPGAAGGPEPPAQVRGAALAADSRERYEASEAATEPIPVIAMPASTAAPGAGSPGRVTRAVTPAPAAPSAPPAPRQSAASAGPAVRAAAKPAPPAPSGRKTPAAPVAPQPAPGPPGQPAPRQVADRTTGHTTGRRRGRGYRITGLLVVVAVIIGGVSFALLHHGGRSTQSSGGRVVAVAPATLNRTAAWVAGQVDASAMVACDPVMCGVLELHGMHANHLRVLWQGTANPAGLRSRRRDASCPERSRCPAQLRLRAGGHRQLWLGRPADRRPRHRAERRRCLPRRV